MQAFGIAAGRALVVSLVFMAFRSRRRVSRRLDLGVISDQWMAQHRASTLTGIADDGQFPEASSC